MLSYETAAVCQQTRAAQHFGTVDNSAGSLFTLLKQTLLCIQMEPTDTLSPWFPGRKNQQIRPYSHLNKFACGFGGAQNTQSTTICAGTQGSILMCFFPSYSVYSEPKGSFAQTQVRFTACSNTSQAAATPHQIHPTVQQQQVPAALGVPQWDFPVLHIIRCYGVIKADTLF